jgi:4-diphosphocytidyl-2-C-methyl-D-erythritol kinase
MQSITVEAPAKVNLFLDVLDKRKDGYHNLSTVFCRTRLFDKVTISRKPCGVSFSCSHPALCKAEKNLAYKAALLMKKKFCLGSGLRVSLKKNIPIAAGLGGGSSDAASVILGINELFKLNAPYKRLSAIGRLLGADVCFFLSKYACAAARGIGDKLTEIKAGSECHLLILVPAFPVYTKTIYKRMSLRLTKPHTDVNILTRILVREDWPDKITKSLYNRLEDVVFTLYPAVKKAKQAMLCHTDKALLSGSGPAIFGIFNTGKEAKKAKALLERDGWKILLTKGA